MIPRVWPGDTVAIIAGGPSLTVEQVELCVTSGVRLILINRSFELTSQGDWLHGCDAWFWENYPAARNHPAPFKTTLEQRAAGHGVKLLQQTGIVGFDDDPSCVRTGGNGAYQATCMAVHAGARRIILVGVDMRNSDDGKTHSHGGYGKRAMQTWEIKSLPHWPSLKEPLAARGVELINATPGSALKCFPMMELAKALQA